MGPILSIDQPKVMHPNRLTRPKLGRNPQVLHTRVGETMLPRVSEPMAKPHRPATTAHALPAEDPELPCSMFQGLRVIPPNH